MTSWMLVIRRTPEVVGDDVGSCRRSKPNGTLLVMCWAIASGMIAIPMPPTRICSSALCGSAARRWIGSKTSTWISTESTAPTSAPSAIIAGIGSGTLAARA